MDLNRYEDPRVFAFLLQRLVDRRESSQVLRSFVLKSIRTAGRAPDDRVQAAAALVQVLFDHSSVNLQIQAALALQGLVDVSGVVTALGRVVADQGVLLDLRYAAFTSLERAGPTTECIYLLRNLQADELLGPTAETTLLNWRVPLDPDPDT